MLNLEPIRDRLAATTRGEWWVDSDLIRASGLNQILFRSEEASEADKKFISYAHSDISKLLAEVERLRDELEKRKYKCLT